MNWEAIGAISEIIGAVAVVATLGYLAVQIRQNTKMARSATRNAISQSAQSLTADILNTPDMADIMLRHMAGEDLTGVEYLKIQGRCYRDMQHWENIYYQYREGLLTQEEFAGFQKNLKALFRMSAYREYWQTEGELYSQNFQDEVNSALDESEKGDSVDITERFRANGQD